MRSTVWSPYVKWAEPFDQEQLGEKKRRNKSSATHIQNICGQDKQQQFIIHTTIHSVSGIKGGDLISSEIQNNTIVRSHCHPTLTRPSIGTLNVNENSLCGQ